MLILGTAMITTCATSCKNNKRNSEIEKVRFYPPSEELEDSVRVEEFTYVSFFCQCAQWITTRDYITYKDTGNISDHTVFIEPIDTLLRLPDTLGYAADVIRFTGRYYKDKGYPKDYPITEQHVNEARVFRYEKYDVVTSNYSQVVLTPQDSSSGRTSK
jgi:hypothetical protein